MNVQDVMLMLMLMAVGGVERTLKAISMTKRMTRTSLKMRMKRKRRRR